MHAYGREASIRESRRGRIEGGCGPIMCRVEEVERVGNNHGQSTNQIRSLSSGSSNRSSAPAFVSVDTRENVGDG
jgi:hypothetical protein